MFFEGEKIYVVRRDDNGNIRSIIPGEIDSITARQIKVDSRVFTTKGVLRGEPNVVLEKVTDELNNIYAEDNKKSAYMSAKTEFFLEREPSRMFSKGDRVYWGAKNEDIVDEVFDEGRFYGFKKGLYYKVIPWISVFPVGCNSGVNIAKKDDVKMTFHGAMISSLLYKAYYTKLDMNPFYQRDYVWELEDKVNLIDSIFNNIDIGKFSFIEEDFEYEVLDGKQRLTALMDFYEDRFRYKGKLFSELSYKDKSHFENYKVTIGETSNLSDVQKAKYFYRLNRAGRVMNENHLEKVLEFISNENINM